MTDQTNGWLMMLSPGTISIVAPVEDRFTELAEKAFAEADPGTKRWRGYHRCVCGKTSDNKDWSVRGMETNSLLVHYVRDHRDAVPQSELDKLLQFEEGR